MRKKTIAAVICFGTCFLTLVDIVIQGWSELKFYGDQLGAGAQGAVRKARWKGNDYAVKVFKTSETTDFEEEVRISLFLKPSVASLT